MIPSECTGVRIEVAKVPSYGGFSVPVQNDGNTARDHLANERTYLAWVRTAITVLTLGLAIAKFDPTGNGVFIGCSFIVLSMVLFVYSKLRYDENSTAIQQGRFMVMKSGAVVLVGVRVSC